MSMFNDIEWRKKGNTEKCLHNATEVDAFATKFKPVHWCFLEPASESAWWNANSTEPQGKCDIVPLQMVDIFECHTSHPIFPATEPLSLGQSRKGRSNLPFPRYIRQQEDSRQDHVGKQFTFYLQSNLPMV